MFGLENKLTLYGFNNLTKTLSFNIYDVCYAKSERAQKDYVAYIDEQYNSERLTRILCDVTEIIGAHVLNISKQDYEPQGASVTLLISENDMPEEMMDKSCNHGHLASRDTFWHTLTKVMLRCIRIRNIIRITLFLHFVWILMLQLAGKFLR